MSINFNPLIYDGFDIGGSGDATIVPDSTPIAGGTPNSILVNKDNKVSEVGPLLDNQVLVGVTGDVPEGATLNGTVDQIAVAFSSGSVTLSTPQDIAATSDVVFNSVSTAYLDHSGAVNIGTVDASVINLGNASAVVNFNGTVNNNNVTNLVVTDQLITVNDGGGAGSASGAGIEVEEDGSITGYIKTSGDRNSYILKAPNQAGIATISPGASGITLDQDSHSPVTLGVSNGLTLSGQQVNLGLSSASTTGALSSTDYNTFNGKVNTDLSNVLTSAYNTSDTTTLGAANKFAKSDSSGTLYAHAIVLGSDSGGAHGYLGNFKNLSSNGASKITLLAQLDSASYTLPVANPTDSLHAVNLTYADGHYLSRSGGSLTGNLDLGTHLIRNVATPVASADAATKAYVDATSLPTDDIKRTTIAGAINTTAALTGFDVGSRTGFRALIKVSIQATTPLYGTYDVIGNYNGSTWDLAVSGIGTTGVTFSMTGSQLYYTSLSYFGFTSMSITFRAEVV